MTVRFLALYETPTDPGLSIGTTARSTFRSGADCRGCAGTRSGVTSRPSAVSPYYLVAELEWDTMEELRAAFASPAGRATALDAARLQEFAPVRSTERCTWARST